MKTDSQLYTDIMEKLEFEPAIDSTNITISVHEGVVTIGGSVESYAEKRAVQRSIRRIEGVKGLANEIEVTLNLERKPSDSEIASTAVHALEWDSTLPRDKIKVTVEHGNVILTGEVNWWYQKQNAEKDVRNLAGVVDIDNQIEVKPALPIISPAEVNDKIIKEFERSALIDALGVIAEVQGTKIILKGKVRSWAEFKEAAEVAWSIPGVTHVDNQLTIRV
jgi:osmotically-inducible protein OsmY